MLEAGAVDVLQADATRCGGITGFLQAAALCAGLSTCRSPRTARPRCTLHALLRRAERCATSSISTTTCASKRMLFDGRADAARAARCDPICRAPGLGLELKRRRERRPLRESEPRCTTSSRGTRMLLRTETASPCPSTPARALDADLRRTRSTARCASTPARARSTRPTPRTTARCRSAWSIPRDVDDVVATVAVCREHGAPIVSPRRRHQPRRPVLQRRGRHRLVEVPEPHPRDRPRAAAARGWSPACVLDELRDARRAARPDLRARPGHPQPLHPRRHDRQQLLRRPLGDGAGSDDRRQRRGARDPHLRRPAHARSARPATTSSERSSRAGGRRGEIYAALAASARPYADLIRAALSRHPAPRLRLQPRRAAAGERLQRRARAGRHARAPASPCSRRRCAWSTSPPARALLVLGYPDVFAAGDHVPRGPASTARSASRASTTR